MTRAKQGLGLATCILVVWFLLRRARRTWEDQLKLADLLVGRETGLGGAYGEREVQKAVPPPIRTDLAKAFARLAVDSSLYTYLFGGADAWRKQMLEDLFQVHLRLNEVYHRSRCFVDFEDRSTSHVPRATCLASIYDTRDPQPGVLDVVEAGGISYFARLGLAGFFRNYNFEQWLHNLKKSCAPKMDYVCIDHFFVCLEARGVGLGTAMIAKIVEEADSKMLPVLAVVFDSNAVNFYQRQGFSSICQERFIPEHINSDAKVPSVMIWLMWKETEASSFQVASTSA